MSVRAPLTGHLRPDGRWMITVTLTRFDGTKKRVPVYAKTQREVQERARELIYGSGRIAYDAKTMEELITEYKLVKWPKLAIGTQRQHSPAYKRILKYFTGDLRKITPAHVAMWLRVLDNDPKLSGRAIQAYRNVLSSLMQFAFEMGWCQGNPAKGVTLPKSAKPKDRRRLTPDEYKLILESETDPVLRDLWELLGETGMRPSEALALRSSDIFYSLDMWWVKGGMKTEAGKGREIPLPDALAHRLSEREDWLFPAPGTNRALLYNHVLELWGKALENAGVAYTNPYQLRKMAVSRWIHAGLPDDVVKAMAGHTDINLTKEVYLRHGRDRLMTSLFSGSSCQSLSDLMKEKGESAPD